MKLFVYSVSWLIASAVPILSFMGPTAFSPRRTTSLNMVADDAKVVMITGASQGLGQAIAYEMAEAGQKVIVNYIAGCEAGAEETVQKCKELGGDAVAIVADCSNPDQVHEMFKKALDAYGGIDVLVNNAGVTRDNLVARMKPADWNLVLSVNLNGVFYCMQEFFQVNEDKGGGRVINMASVVGQIGNPGQANYAASKGGVIGLTKSCAREMGPKGFKVNAICPGFIDTAMAHKLGDDKLELVTKSIPLQRLGKPEEVAAVARFLALDKGADYITGHCFDIDGGIALAAA